jgi:hypothetical protein
LIRVADATHSRYSVADKTVHHNHKCTEAEAEDESNAGRIEKCASFTPCYNVDKADNELCTSKHESCSIFVDGTGVDVNGCILSQHCGKTGDYLSSPNIEFTCPAGVKEMVHHQPLGLYEYEKAE